MLKQIVLLTALSFAAFPALAATGESLKETCKIEASFELEGPTQIFCDGDLSVADGVEISTKGHGLQIVSMGRVFFGTANGLGLNITAKAMDAGKVFIYARTASGSLNIDNKAESFGADIEIEYGSSFGYVQTVDTGTAAEVRMSVNGQKLQL